MRHCARLLLWPFAGLLLSIFVVTGKAADAKAPNRSGADAAREQLKKMKVAEGLEIGLYALEPLVRNPSAMDIDARGRIWIAEGTNYRVWQKWGKQSPEGDRIVILEDTNGDGQADKETTFYQGNDVNTALGICVLGDRVLVSCSPNILLFTDANGDDKPDKKEVLFTGIKGVDHDHGVHAFTFGPEGKLYFNMGNEGQQLKTADGKLVIDRAGNEVVTKGKPYRQGLLFRCNQDGSDLETIGHNFRNNFEAAVDSFGNVWQSDNDDDGNQGVRINFIMEYGNYGFTDEMTGAGWGVKRTNLEKEIPLRHWHQNDPGVVPNLLLTGAGSPTGIASYEGDLLPQVFRNQVIHCDAGPRVVRAYPVKVDGAGFHAEITNILSSDDTWFRPSDVSVAPDGSIYVADWNDAGVGGHHMEDQSLETMTGRIYRVAPPGNRPTVPPLDLSTPAGAIEALKSPNRARWFLAWTRLHEPQQQAQAEPLLSALWTGDNPVWRARAFHLLVRTKGSEQKYLDQAMQDRDPAIRTLALRYARVENKDSIPIVKALVNDPSAQVRRECAISLRNSSSPEIPKLWAALAQKHDGKDRWYLEALGIGADKQWEPCFDAWLAAVGDRWNTPAGRDIVWRSRSRKTPALLSKIINDKSTPAEERDRYFRAFDFIQGPEKDAALLELLTGK